MHVSHPCLDLSRLNVPVFRFILPAALLLVCNRVMADPLNPGSFTSVGTMNVANGSITIDTGALTITGAASFNGVSMSQGGSNPDIAVFTFTNFYLGPTVTIKVTGSRPLALLSQGSMTIESPISLIGGNGSNSMAGAGGGGGGFAGGVGGNTGSDGGGPGGGQGSGSSYSSGGGGYGGAGGIGDLNNSAGGVSYGDLLTVLQGGSGGGGARIAGGGGTAGGGGGGGGALELGSLGQMTLSASVESHGGTGAGGTNGGGGGAGGAILVHAGSMSLFALSAHGGSALGGGGGGGGGRIAILGGSFTPSDLSSEYGFLNGGFGPHEDGKAGVLVLKPTLLTVPSGESVDIGITTGQTGFSDPRIELFPRNLTVHGGGTANVVSPVSWTNHESIVVTGGLLNVQGAATFGTGVLVDYSAGNLIMSTAATLQDDARILLTPGGDKVLRMAGLSMSGTSKIDLVDNDMIIEGSTDPSTIRSFIQTGRNGGNWMGNRITSYIAASDPTHRALGYALASDIFNGGGGMFDGVSVSSSAVLVKYTFPGDTNLDGVVNLYDLVNLATNWQTGSTWVNGDFDYNGVVNSTDLGMLAMNWQSGSGAPLGQALADVGLPVSGVPEPGAVANLAIGLILLRRRRTPIRHRDILRAEANPLRRERGTGVEPPI